MSRQPSTVIICPGLAINPLKGKLASLYFVGVEYQIQTGQPLTLHPYLVVEDKAVTFEKAKKGMIQHHSP